jgi:hypothetical protein
LDDLSVIVVAAGSKPPVQTLGERLAVGIAALSRICDNGRVFGTAGTGRRTPATAPWPSRPRIATRRRLL